MSSQDPIQQQQQQQQRIPNPRRLLILSPSSHSPTTIPSFLLALTGSPVLDPPSASSATSASTEQPHPTSFAGYTTHPPLQIRNRYYAAEVPVWVDEIALDGSESEAETGVESAGTGAEAEAEPLTTPSVWKTEFSGPDAKVVRDAIGAVVVCIVNPTLAPSPSPAPNVNLGLDLDSTPESTVTEPSRTRTAPETQAQTQTQSLKNFLRAVGEVRALIEEERGGMGDVPGLVVLVDQGGQTVQKGQNGTEGADALGEDDLEGVDADEPFSIPWWEDQLYDMGLLGMEVVRWDAKGGKEMETEERNQFGGIYLSSLTTFLGLRFY